MIVSEAFVYYGGRVLIFAIVAGIGIATGIRLRKAKDAKATDNEE